MLAAKSPTGGEPVLSFRRPRTRRFGENRAGTFVRRNRCGNVGPVLLERMLLPLAVLLSYLSSLFSFVRGLENKSYEELPSAQELQ